MTNPPPLTGAELKEIGYRWLVARAGCRFLCRPDSILMAEKEDDAWHRWTHGGELPRAICIAALRALDSEARA